MRLLATTYLHYSSKAKGKGTYAPSEVPVASVARHAMTLRMRTVTAMRRATLCLIPNRRFRLEPGCVAGVVADDGPPVVGALERVHQQHEPGARRTHRLTHLTGHTSLKKNVEL